MPSWVLSDGALPTIHNTWNAGWPSLPAGASQERTPVVTAACPGSLAVALKLLPMPNAVDVDSLHVVGGTTDTPASWTSILVGRDAAWAVEATRRMGISARITAAGSPPGRRASRPGSHAWRR